MFEVIIILLVIIIGLLGFIIYILYQMPTPNNDDKEKQKILDTLDDVETDLEKTV